jgi:hypothetical protein
MNWLYIILKVLSIEWIWQLLFETNGPQKKNGEPP